MRDENNFWSARNSALDPAGPEASFIADLSWWMIWGFTGVFVVVMIALLIAVFFRPPQAHNAQPPLGISGFIVTGGIIIPLLVVGTLLFYTLAHSKRAPQTDENSEVIQITGHMWWWDVYYPKHNIRIANELYIPVGKAVRVELRSNDVIHSFWVPSLAGKTDLIPGFPNFIALEASEPGFYRGQCAELCGLQHAKMGLIVVALEDQKFKDWIEDKKSKPLTLNSQDHKALKIFHQSGCAQCHAIKNTDAKGSIGPDLTHIGSRITLGAGTLNNSFGALAGWIADPQSLKPGNRMPRTYLSPEDLHALTTYLEGLK